MQIGFYFNQSRCIGCYACVVACKDWHDVPAGPASWVRVITNERGQFPNVSISNFFSTCFHCANPLCIRACPVGAIAKRRKDGIVVVDREVCLGNVSCDACLKACPYDAPQFGDEENAKMQKCDLCLERWPDKKPVCVEACPVRGLDAGPLDELKAKYGDIREAEGFVFSKRAAPSINFKLKSRG